MSVRDEAIRAMGTGWDKEAVGFHCGCNDLHTHHGAALDSLVGWLSNPEVIRDIQAATGKGVSVEQVQELCDLLGERSRDDYS